VGGLEYKGAIMPMLSQGQQDLGGTMIPMIACLLSHHPLVLHNGALTHHSGNDLVGSGPIINEGGGGGGGGGRVAGEGRERKEESVLIIILH